MSQSSNSGSDMNIFSQLSSIVADNKVNVSTIERALKRSASIELGNETKKTLSEYSSNEKQVSGTVTKGTDEPKFITARMIIGSAAMNIQTIPEISDEELLQMTLDFEKKHGQ